jgi:hypothetical protein
MDIYDNTVQVNGEILDEYNYRNATAPQKYIRRVRLSTGEEFRVKFNSDFIPEKGVQFTGTMNFACDSNWKMLPDQVATISPQKYVGPVLPPGEPDEKGHVRPHGASGMRRGYDSSLDPNLR